MPLEELTVQDLRCLTEVRLTPHPRFNLIYGENASGKTSLLEAIFFLGRGRSFRTANSQRLIRQGTDAFLVAGKAETRGRERRAGVRFSRSDGAEVRVDGAPAPGLSSLAEVLPVQVIDPEVHRLVAEGPEWRRRYLDWGVFHVEHQYLADWRRYRRALRQRNAALRQGSPNAVLESLEPELAAAGQRLDQARRAYLAELAPVVDQVVRTFLGTDEAGEEGSELAYSPGWPEDADLAQALAADRRRDRDQGFTLRGPHRADLVIRLGGRRARERVSRGQEKLLASAMVLGQLQHLKAATGEAGVLLLDDPAAELDPGRLETFMATAGQLQAQLFVTTLVRDAVPVPAEMGVFHVEHGVVNPTG